MDTEQTVTISAARLAELEAAEAKLKARKAAGLEDLKKFAEAHPENAKERYKRYVEKNKEAINARRRELYKQKKIANQNGNTAAAVSPN